jgi:uncharacterized membrane protein YhhN
MKNKLHPLAQYVFLLLTAVNLYAEFVYWREAIFVTRIFLLPMLAVYYATGVAQGNWTALHKFMLAGIVFSFVGDFALLLTPNGPDDLAIMGVPKNKYYFFGGVAGFFVAHLCFIKAYLSSKATVATSLYKRAKWPFALVVAYAIAILAIVVPKVYADPEKNIITLPIIGYTMVIASMVSIAINRYSKVSQGSFVNVLVGAVLFFLSDSLIALNFLAFNNAIPLASFWIMITFLAAEYFMAKGMLSEQ